MELRPGDRARLEALARSTTAPAGLVQRARIVLLAAGGVSNTDIALRTSSTRPTVLKWRARYLEAGLAGLGDLPRPGRKAEINEVAVLAETLANKGRPPVELGVQRWSSRLLAARLGISFATVTRIWRKWRIQAHRVEAVKFATVPALEPRADDIAGLRLARSVNAVVVGVVTGAPNQAPAAGPAGHQTPAQLRDAAVTPLAMLDGILGDGEPEDGGATGFLAFLEKVAQARPRTKLHVVADSAAVAGHPDVRAWLDKNSRITLYVTTGGCPWPVLAEILFGVVTRQAARRGAFSGVDDLEDAIRDLVASPDRPVRPFAWVCGPHEPSVNRQ